MTIRTTRWEPDTHNFVIDYEWNDALPEDERIHVPVRAWARSVDDKGTVTLTPLKDAAAIHDQALTENRRKNEAIAHVLDALPEEMTKAELDSDGDPTGQRIVKDKHQPEWRMNEDGTVTVSVPGADEKSLTALSASVAEKFGAAVSIDA